MSTTTTSISSGKRTGIHSDTGAAGGANSHIGGGGRGAMVPHVNPNWARLPLFNCKNWSRVGGFMGSEASR